MGSCAWIQEVDALDCSALESVSKQYVSRLNACTEVDVTSEKILVETLKKQGHGSRGKVEGTPYLADSVSGGVEAAAQYSLRTSDKFSMCRFPP